ncbi:MAG: 50S ribosomal protein L29 [Parachlamydiaceae bacterium]
MTKAKDLRDQSIEELEAARDDARKALFMLRNEMNQGGKVEKPHRIRQQRKEIARLLTVLHEKQLALGK